MEPQNTTPPQITPSLPPQRSRGKALVVIVLILLLAIGATGAGYFFGNKTDREGTSTNTPTTGPAITETTQEAPSVHFVQSIGYPFDVNKKLTFKLGLPNTFQGVAIQSNIPNPGYTTYLTNKFNDEMGRFVIGNPQLPNATREISLLAIGKEWLNSTTEKADILAFEDVSTPAKKQRYITSLASSTDECIKDPKKGFQTSDKNLRICYSLSSGKDGWLPTVTLKGYGLIEGVPVVMLGYVDLSENKTLPEAEDLKLRQEAAKGNFPDSTNNLLSELISALSQSTLTPSNR
jgi:hypothetical protein